MRGRMLELANDNVRTSGAMRGHLLPCNRPNGRGGASAVGCFRGEQAETQDEGGGRRVAGRRRCRRAGAQASAGLPSAAVSEAPESAAPEPPVFEERRRTPDRRQAGRRREDSSFYLRTAAAAAVAICGGLAIVYLFFAALGAVDIEEAAVATAVALVMGTVWLAGYFVRHRQLSGGSPRTTDQLDRERRGF